MNRRAFLAAGAAACGGALFTNGGTRWGSSGRETSSIGRGPTIDLEEVAEGLGEPLALATPERNVRFIAERGGLVRRHDSNGLRDAPVLDVSDRLVAPETWEQGLLGLALHPEFGTNRRYYVRYSAPKRPGTPDDFSHTFVLSEFRATADLTGTVPGSERTILEIPQQGPNHNAGALAFGPDGFLYVGVGDGNSLSGDSGRGHANDWYLLNGGGNGQNVTDNLRGSVLRIDVDERADGKPYAVPDDNPLVGRPGLDEQYAWGFRNPYRLSFDGTTLFVGDVGEGSFEEVNVVERGGNYGWNVREGPECFSNRLTVAALAKLPGVEKTYPFCPRTTRGGDPLRDPAIVYPHLADGGAVGVAVVGGYRYRNDAVPELRGAFVFGDLVGGLFAATAPERGERFWPIESLSVASSENGSIGDSVLSLGRDADGELYVLTTRFQPGSGKLFRIVAA